MTIEEILAPPCPDCGVSSGAECVATGILTCEARMDVARAHRARDVCPECGAAVGRWCTCLSRMDAAQPGEVAIAAAQPAQLEMFA